MFIAVELCFTFKTIEAEEGFCRHIENDFQFFYGYDALGNVSFFHSSVAPSTSKCYLFVHSFKFTRAFLFFSLFCQRYFPFAVSTRFMLLSDTIRYISLQLLRVFRLKQTKKITNGVRMQNVHHSNTIRWKCLIEYQYMNFGSCSVFFCSARLDFFAGVCEKWPTLWAECVVLSRCKRCYGLILRQHRS